jgi:tetratricopeptide (TPR) repeat protein
MKTKTIILFALLCIIHMAWATDDKYTETMKKNIQSVYTAQSIPDIQQAVNAFERIGAAEKNKWEPFYYAAWGYIMIANRETDGAKKDAVLDQAQAAIKKAQEIVPAESEVVALQGFVHMIRVTVDPASRGQQYSALAYQSLNKAVAINPENPRALTLLGQMQFGTAQFFGSPTTEACATITKALEKFAATSERKPLAPEWGKGMADGLKGKCQ